MDFNAVKTIWNLAVCSSDRWDDVFIQQQNQGGQMLNFNGMGKLCIYGEVWAKWLPAAFTVN